MSVLNPSFPAWQTVLYGKAAPRDEAEYIALRQDIRYAPCDPDFTYVQRLEPEAKVLGARSCHYCGVKTAAQNCECCGGPDRK